MKYTNKTLLTLFFFLVCTGFLLVLDIKIDFILQSLLNS